jgi:hypothetical protein
LITRGSELPPVFTIALVDSQGRCAGRVDGNILRTLGTRFYLNGATDVTFSDKALSGITAGRRFVGGPGSATGVSVIDNSWQFANAAPTAEYHFVGERVWKSSPSGSNPMGWICTTAGTPGTWTAMRTSKE